MRVRNRRRATRARARRRADRHAPRGAAGQLRDLCEIFARNGAPSANNPYVFNGDLVDRGEHSLEVRLVLFGLAAADPSAVYVNRGNHEDYNVCESYGFIDEIIQKCRRARCAR